MFGALLLMSHSSHQKDWGSTNELVDAVVHETETMSIEGMYGAGITGRGGCVLVAGQPFIVPRCLDRIQVALKERFNIRPDVTLL
jgi:galactokinase